MILRDSIIHLKNLKNSLSAKEWLEKQWNFLEQIGLPEFSGCDIDIIQLLEQIPSDAEDIDIQHFLQHTLVENLHEQLERGGNSILLDIEKLKQSPASVLVPRIVELRKKELEETKIQVVGKEIIVYDVFMRELDRILIPGKDENVLLDSLWLTAHGYQLLSSLGYGRRTDMKGLRKIEQALKKLDVSPSVERVSKPQTIIKKNVSPAMLSLILSRIGS
jgi:hypothetical protein